MCVSPEQVSLETCSFSILTNLKLPFKHFQSIMNVSEVAV